MALVLKHTAIVFALVTMLSGAVLAQAQPAFIKMNKSKDLSSGSVTSIAQDKDGFMWIGTKSGLSRYDGSSFRLFNQQHGGLSANDVSTIYVDSKGRMWVATINGLNLFNNNTEQFSFFKYQSDSDYSISSNEINTVYEDSNGKIWIGTENGLNQFVEKDSTFVRYFHKNDKEEGVSHNSVKAIFEDDQHNLWIGTFGGGLNKLNKQDGNFVSLDQQKETFFPRYINVIKGLSDEALLIGTSGEGLLVFDRQTGLFTPYFKDGQHLEAISIVRAIYKDSHQNIWIGTDGDGLIRITPHSETRTQEIQQFVKNNQVQSSLSSNAIYSIYEDHELNLWIGTAWNGINILAHQEAAVQNFYSDFQGSNPSPVLSIFKKDNTLWFGTDGYGLNIYDLALSQLLQFDKSVVGGDYIQLIQERKKGGYFIGTFTNGLMIFDPKQGIKKHFKHHLNNVNSLSYHDVRAVIEEKNGNFWVGTWGGGLCYYDEHQGKFYAYKRDENFPKSISNDNVTALTEANDGKIWVGTFGGGLNLFDPSRGEFTHFMSRPEDASTISSNNIVSLLKDTKGNLWIGTWDNGLCKITLDTYQVTRFGSHDGIRENTITAMLEDEAGNIWISTKNGITKFDHTTQSFERFPQLNGEYHINASFKDGKMLYFGNNEGAVAFDSEKISNMAQEPDIKLTGFKLFNKNVQIGDGTNVLDKNILYEDFIELKHNHSVITFEFTTLKFPIANYEYAIKLENFDHEWREIGTQQSATFTNLAPGNYTFKVKAKTPGSNWESNYKAIDLLVHKPLWKMWWAYVGYTITFVFLLYLFYRYTIQWEKLKSKLQLEKVTREKERELNKLKLKFFTNVSHEIRTPVTLILGAVNRIAEDIPDRKFDAIQEVRRNSKHLLQLVNELLDFRKLESEGVKLKATQGNFVEFVKEIYLSFTSHAASLNIDYRFLTEKEHIDLWFDRNQMEKVVYNLLSNAFKYTEAGGAVTVDIREKEQQVHLVVADTGRGIPETKLDKIFKRFYQSDNNFLLKKEGFGIGLSITRNIVKLHSGEISVKSEVNKGTEFLVKLKCGDKHLRSNQKIAEFNDNETIEHYIAMVPEEKENPVFAKGLKATTILIVEDNEGIRNYLQELLGPHFDNILQAGDGKEALEIAFSHIPDLIISDIMMPKMDGIALTKALKTDVRTSHIPIILLTARTSLIYKKEGFETGADDYVTKPFSESLLKTRIINLLKTRQALREKFQLESLSEPRNLPINTPDQAFLTELTKILEDNLDNDALKAEFIAKEIGISHSVVYKKIKSLTGMSLVEFIRDFRLKRAAQLLEQYDLPVTDVCYKVGFSDRRYFSQMFKKRFGKTPSEFAHKVLK